MSRSLHLYYRDNHSIIDVVDSDKTTLLYCVNRNSSKPHLTVYRVSEHDSKEMVLVGQASFHHFKSNIDLEFSGESITMTKAGFLSSDFTVASADFHGTWERDGALTSNIKLVDRSNWIVASFENASFSRAKQGTMNIMGNPTQKLLDIIILTGLAKIQKQKRDSTSRSGANAAIYSSGG